MGVPGQDLYRALARALWLATGLILALWFLHTVFFVVLLFALAFVLVLVLNPPVTWLEQRRVPRVVGALLVCGLVASAFALLGWLVVPRLADQLTHLARNLPGYIRALEGRLSVSLRRYPTVQAWLHPGGQALMARLPSMPSVLGRIGSYTLSLFELAACVIVLVSTVVYSLIRPRPLLENYLMVLPVALRDRAQRAFTRGSRMVVGWIYAHLIIGAIEAVCAGIFLALIHVPGSLVWASFTFFAELVPRIGPYVMAVPPILEALALSPMKALYVVGFYIALNETMGTFVLPFLWGREMDLHPVSLLFAVLALARAFGLLGALLAVPITGFVKAFYEEFYLSTRPHGKDAEQRTEEMLNREVTPAHTPAEHQARASPPED